MTIAELLTVPGAAAAASLLVQAAKAAGLPSRWCRPAAVGFAVVGVIGATLLQDPTWPALFLAPVTGAAAGLAAIAGYDAVTSGTGYRVTTKDGS